ncbi:MAG TPA: hypothetical protein P5518_01390 [Candidatus Cloacimonas sp.]|jgi:hypothetical protein|nr:hypothetical protein [Candidatus Cloacimonas sp.]MDD2249662.1 hypothetical protein [Candidatus Cloacimonadota bacterium]MCK9158042.1 hypothetical protein [Candidatus Cloacimonas sp.]MCK9164909.1 hypothetical protein [Candidatus Cloacimonas sp.]MDD3733633.1 hypothetical protein [Candidatus Cloacimonadota bacterium]
MQLRFIKDLTIALIVISLFAMAVQLVGLYRSWEAIPDKSVHTKESVSDTLLSRIKSIENSIQDRKMFVFNSNKDPLRQGNIIKDKIDREKEYQEMLKNTFRLATTARDEFGNKIAYIEYQGKLYEARVGDIVEGRRILDIQDKSIRYSHNGIITTTELAPRPAKPVEETTTYGSGTSGNW